MANAFSKETSKGCWLRMGLKMCSWSIVWRCPTADSWRCRNKAGSGRQSSFSSTSPWSCWRPPQKTSAHQKLAPDNAEVLKGEQHLAPGCSGSPALPWLQLLRFITAINPDCCRQIFELYSHLADPYHSLNAFTLTEPSGFASASRPAGVAGRFYSENASVWLT